MAHGFPGHKAGNNDLYGDIEFLLTEKGLHTLRFDFRGCGESEGEPEDFTMSSAIEDFQNVLYWGRDKGFKNYILIGDGLGASLAVLNAERSVNGLILLWPVLDLKAYSQAVFGKPSVEDKKKDYIEFDGRRVGLGLLREMEKVDMARGLSEVRAPTLILHGAEDKIVPVSQLDLARKHISADRIEITTFHDGEHGLQKLNHRKMMFYHITQFIEKYA
ncbi:MAG: hypothetical protein DHS20C02_16730 [Micavibrio sp.]|nr:MAG: hypothetical protein DHS20C02_16730 [Micavibrio sp.]